MAPSEFTDDARLALLQSLDLLRPQQDPSLDRIATIAALGVGTPTALVTFLAPGGQWVAARHGWDCGFHPLSESFCLHALAGAEVLEVCDATADARFAHNGLVTGAAGVRFYAGHPIEFDGHRLGAVCVLDVQPRQLTAAHAQLLEQLAGLVVEQLRLRLARSSAARGEVRGDRLLEALQASERTLRESEERYRLLWQTTTDAVLIIDDLGLIQFANPALERLFGRRPDEVVGGPLGQLQPERLRGPHDRAFAAYRQSGRRTLNWRATETVGLHANGSEIPIEIAFSELPVGGRRHFAAFMRDLSERHRAQLALRHSDAQFRALTALSSDWYWELDADCRYTVISEGAHRSGLLDTAAALGRRPWELGGAGSVDGWAPQRDKLLQREAFRDLELVVTDLDGAGQVLSISGEPVFDDGGAFAGYRGVGRNVTPERRAEERRRELEDHLRQSQKLEAIGALAGGIAHDFNNIVAGILGNAQLALQDLAPGHPAVQSVEQIRKAGLRGRDMVQQILTFARRRPKRPVRCDVGELVDETLGLVRPTVPTSVKIQRRLPERPLHVFADPTQLEQALINLCANAWQAMAGRPGHIEIGAAEVTLGGEAADLVGGLQPGRYVHLTVRDDGPGMDEATCKRVFEPFFTTKPEGQGTGLGLSVVHGIVRGHGGAITVESAPGRGCTFNLWLPAGRPGGAAAAAQPADRAVDGAGRQVLYVDDDEVLTLMVSRLLERANFRVTVFSQGAQALAWLQQAPWAVDALVTDLNMPGLSGLEVLREALALRASLPVIIGSGNLSLEALAEAQRAGVRATFNKQNVLDELPALLAEVLGL